MRAYCGNQWSFSVNGSTYSSWSTSWNDLLSTERGVRAQLDTGSGPVVMNSITMGTVSMDELVSMTNCDFVLVKRTDIVSIIDRLGGGEDVAALNETVAVGAIFFAILVGLAIGIWLAGPRRQSIVGDV